jgi:hypothetical protein
MEHSAPFFRQIVHFVAVCKASDPYHPDPSMHIDSNNSRGRFAANGRMAPEQAVELAISALAGALAEQVSSVLLNMKDVFLTRCLSITECHDVGVQLAAAGRGLSKVALVARPECVEPHHFIFMVARNRGLEVLTFANESQAVGWLAG